MNTTRVKFKALRVIEYEYSNREELSFALGKRSVNGSIHFNGNTIREVFVTPIYSGEVVTTGGYLKNEKL